MDGSANFVLVHGAWADGSSWSGVIERLQATGYHVTAPQFGMNALADDVAFAGIDHVLTSFLVAYPECWGRSVMQWLVASG